MLGTSAVEPRFWLSERATPHAVRSMREAVTRFAAKNGAVPDLLHAVKLAVSEALTNVVLHAYVERSVPGPMTLEAWAKNDCLYVVVCDEGSGMAPRLDSPGLGLGLPLVANLADDFRVEARKTEDGTRVAMRFSLDGSGVA